MCNSNDLLVELNLDLVLTVNDYNYLLFLCQGIPLTLIITCHT